MWFPGLFTTPICVIVLSNPLSFNPFSVEVIRGIMSDKYSVLTLAVETVEAVEPSLEELLL